MKQQSSQISFNRPILICTLVILNMMVLSFSGIKRDENTAKTDEKMKRSIKRIVRSSTSRMDFIIMKQPLPHREVEQIDPFLLLHHHGPVDVKPNNPGLPFGPHPHRGFETVTFIFKGDVKHKDSHGFESVINDGGVQWMTAGRGLVHSERSSEKFKEEGGALELIQLWVNLPASQKMAAPKYEGLQKEKILSFEQDEGLVKVDLVSGDWGKRSAPQRGLYPIDLASVTVKKGGVLKHQITKEKNILFYVREGTLMVNGKQVEGHQLVHFDNDGETLEIEAVTESRFIIGAGYPIGERVVSHGPFVMNSEEELMQAVEDYHEGKMGILRE